MAYSNSASATGNSTTPSVSRTGVNSGDVVYLACTYDSAAATFTWPSGFSELAQVDLTLDGHTTGYARKVAGGAEPATYDITIGGSPGAQDWCLAWVAFSGRDTTTPETAKSSASSNASNASPVSVNGTAIVAVAGDDGLMISLPDVNASGIGNGHAAPSNYTERIDVELAFSNLAIFTRDNMSAGSTGTVTATFSLTSGASGWWAGNVAVAAAAGAAPSPRFLGVLGVGT